MKTVLDAIENRLSEEQKERLRRIYAPKIVAVPPSDARRSLCYMPDGSIRSYGSEYDDTGEKVRLYYESCDGGLSWVPHSDRSVMGSCTYFPDKKRFITAVSSEKDGLYVLYSDQSADDLNPRRVSVASDHHIDIYQPQQSAFGHRIWFTAQHPEGDEYLPDYYVSEDFGESWTRIKLPLPPQQPLIYPHKGYRWRISTGTEPYAVELSENNMMMILRNSTDQFYVTHSHDGGYTWSEYEPSHFYGTATTAFLLRLSDSRTVCFWNNTKPLSEVNHTHQKELNEDNRRGHWEDVFTNRDAAHAAITEDGGNSWKGYREILLNPARNNTDFRYTDDRRYRGDKSVHQFQALELPFGKILVAAGQNPASRRLLIFDINWLYETDRTEDFMDGLKNISSHMYLKSLNGDTRHAGNGHCAWNRINGAVMMPDPSGVLRDVVYLSKREDPRLYYTIPGVVWNFPASKQGVVSTELALQEKRVRITLSDRWFNACDEHAGSLSPFTFELDTLDIPSDFTVITVRYDTEQGYASVYAGETLLFGVAMSRPAPTGLSYFIIQCATDGDSHGMYIRGMKKTEQ